MRILISSVGTRGDVQPAIALALELHGLGCEVRLCVPPNFIAWATELGFDARPIGIEMRPPRPGETPAPIPDLIADQFETVGAAAEGCDLIVGAGVHQYAARSIAELRAVPYVVAAYAPGSLNVAEAEREGWNRRSLDRVNANRGWLGLGPVADVVAHILGDEPWLAADPVLGPAPERLRVVQTGAWVLRDGSALPDEVEAFLAAGEPPVYLGFGSMPASGDFSRSLIEAARAVGRRAILSAGWAGLAAIDEAPDCLGVGDLNHQALFARVAAVVHHGGAGTTATAALAGAPQVAVPMFSDQFFWAARICELGIGATTPAAGLSTLSMAEALAEALRPGVAERARAVAAKVTANGAATAAARLLETYG